MPSPPEALAFFSQAAGPGFRRTTTAQQLYVPPEVFVWLRALGMDELPECLTPTEKRKIMHQLSSFAAQRRAPAAEGDMFYGMAEVVQEIYNLPLDWWGRFTCPAGAQNMKRAFRSNVFAYYDELDISARCRTETHMHAHSTPSHRPTTPHPLPPPTSRLIARPPPPPPPVR